MKLAHTKIIIKRIFCITNKKENRLWDSLLLFTDYNLVSNEQLYCMKIEWKNKKKIQITCWTANKKDEKKNYWSLSVNVNENQEIYMRRTHWAIYLDNLINYHRRRCFCWDELKLVLRKTELSVKEVQEKSEFLLPNPSILLHTVQKQFLDGAKVLLDF